MYEEGHGTAQSLVQAHMWWNLSAARGDKESQKFRDEVSKKMTRQQIAEAQKKQASSKLATTKGATE